MAANPNEPYPSFLDEAEVSSLRQRVHELAKISLEGRLGLLIGAGFSYTARGLPLGGTLAAMLVREALGTGCPNETAYKLASKYGLAAAAQRFHDEVTGQRPALVKFLKTELSKKAGKPTDALKRLWEVITAAGVTRVFTTNYDSLIEEELPSRGMLVKDSVAGITAFELAEEKEFKVGVFHIYGDVEKPLITDEDLKDVQSVHLNEFRSQLVRKVFAFIGYSFRDDDLVAIYREIAEVLRRTDETSRPFIVMPVDDGYEYRFAKELWRRRHNFTLIPLDGGAFLGELHREILDNKLTVAAGRVVERAGVSEDVALERLREAEKRAGLLDAAQIESIAWGLRSFTAGEK